MPQRRLSDVADRKLRRDVNASKRRPVRTLGGGSVVQRGQIKPRMLTLGQVTSRTYQLPPYKTTSTGLLA
jgi:hypothetical protein